MKETFWSSAESRRFVY